MNQNESLSLAESRQWQRRSFLAASFLAIVAGGVFAFTSCPRQGSQSFSLDEKVNPNTAPAASLMRLPGIGPARAEAIIRLRESAAAVGGETPYNSPRDLQRVRGIGPKTSEGVSGSLSFEREGL